MDQQDRWIIFVACDPGCEPNAAEAAKVDFLHRALPNTACQQAARFTAAAFGL
jgi:hypothetical protein